jgi:hypothetical protein
MLPLPRLSIVLCAACGYVAPGDDKAATASPIRANVDAFFIWGWGPTADPLTISFK